MEQAPITVQKTLMALPTLELTKLYNAINKLTEEEVEVKDLPQEWWKVVLEGRKLQEDIATPIHDNVTDPRRLWDNKLEVLDGENNKIILKPTRRAPSTGKLTEATVDMLFAEEQAETVT